MATMLVPLSPRMEGVTGAARPLAGFVAQVIACDQGLAGHRVRRRAPPAEASALYRARDEARGRAGRFTEREV